MPEYVRPERPHDALKCLAQPGSQPVVLGPRPEPWPFSSAEVLVDLRGLGLDYVTRDEDGGLRLGGLTPLASLAEAPLLANLPGQVLAQAARLATQPGLMRVATLAGALSTYHGAPELRLALLALDGEVVIETQSGMARQGADALVPDAAVVTAVVLPLVAGGAALSRVARAPRDLAIVAAVARVVMAKGVCQVVRLAVAGAGPRPARVPAAERALEGQALTPIALKAAAQAVVDAIEPAGDFRGSAEYRRAMAGVLARRALAQAAGNS